jgi:hypothetical protein
MNENNRGQVLPLFALMLIALLAIAALAIDVSNALQARRYYRTIADAAALAGGQDLQQVGSRAVNAGDYNRARAHAIQSVESEVGASATCTLTGNRSDCSFANLPYAFSVVTPIPAGACATCDPTRSVQVGFANPDFGLSFARVVGQNTWNVAITSVAGLQFNKAYTIVTLRPPASATIPGVRDISITGNTSVIVSRGDVGINANMYYGGTGSTMQLDPGYRAYYYDPVNTPGWYPNQPTASRIYQLIADPGYVIPTADALTPRGGPMTDAALCGSRATYLHAQSNYVPYVPWNTVTNQPNMAKITCYTKGVYNSTLSVRNGDLAILEPGLYFFNGGVDAQGSLIGGYMPGAQGVALVFPEGIKVFKNTTNGSVPGAVLLNAGSKFGNPSGVEATAALDFSNAPVQTNTDPATLMTVMVQRDSRCIPVSPFPSSCSNGVEQHNTAIDLTGRTSLYLAGVQFMPADNASISGNSLTGGYVGQVWAWTLTYTGESRINQEGAQSAKPGILRLDAACTAPSTPCIP